MTVRFDVAGDGIDGETLSPCLEPIRSVPGVPGPLADPRAAHLDAVPVLGSPGGPDQGSIEKLAALACRLAAARERDRRREVDPIRTPRRAPGGVLRVPRGGPAYSEDAFMARPARVTHVDGTGASGTSGGHASSRAAFDAVCDEFGLARDRAPIDVAASSLVTRPWEYDVVVAESPFGDVLSALGTALVGGPGRVPVADVGDEHAVFGTRGGGERGGGGPGITAGRGGLAPVATFLAGAMMLDRLGERRGSAAARDAGARLRAAVDAACADGKLAAAAARGARADAAAVADAVRDRLIRG